jgi:hypothetical protein
MFWDSNLTADAEKSRSRSGKRGKKGADNRSIQHARSPSSSSSAHHLLAHSTLIRLRLSSSRNTLAHTSVYCAHPCSRKFAVCPTRSYLATLIPPSTPPQLLLLP